MTKKLPQQDGPQSQNGDVHFDAAGLFKSPTPEQDAADLEFIRDQLTSWERLQAERADDGYPEVADNVPVVFLDMDDVMALNTDFGGYDAIEAVRGKHPTPELVFEKLFSAPAVSALHAVHAELGQLRYVVSSTWREFFGRSQMIELLKKGGLEFVAAGLGKHGLWSTPIWPDRHRLNEVAFWLQKHGNGTPFVVIDDPVSGVSFESAKKTELAPFHGRVVMCGVDVGLVPEHVPRILEALRTPVKKPKLQR